MEEAGSVYFVVSYPSEEVYGIGVAGPRANGEEKAPEVEKIVYREDIENANPEVGKNIDVSA